MDYYNISIQFRDKINNGAEKRLLFQQMERTKRREQSKELVDKKYKVIRRNMKKEKMPFFWGGGGRHLWTSKIWFFTPWASRLSGLESMTAARQLTAWLRTVRLSSLKPASRNKKL